MTNLTVTFMVGLPGVGKSTIINDMLKLPSVSTDEYFEMYAKENSLTYNEAFLQVNFADAERNLNERLSFFINNKIDFAWDQTMLTKKSRAKNLAKIPAYYDKQCIHFVVTDNNEWERRLNSRPGKTIPKHVLLSMFQNYEYPTLDEGFSRITKIVV